MKIAGIDEAGRGPIAGPVVAAAVVLPQNYINQEITDSKKISKIKRAKLVDIIKKDSLSWSIIAVGHKRVDRLNIREATKLAMSLALKRVDADFARIDGNMLIDTDLPQEAIVKGDLKHVEISAASILAKVYRDQLMEVLDSKYQGYHLAQHAGYPTKLHKKLVRDLGPSPIHRKTFRGVKELI